jgi:high affinity Mn2+ porin
VRRLLVWSVVSLGACLGAPLVRAQTPASTATTSGSAQAAEESTTLFPHPDTLWWLSGQLNVISQAHGTFTAPYSGANSLRAVPERATSRVWTIYTGLRVGSRLEVLVDVESAGGRGISDALGLAGFTNLDVVRNPDLGAAPYLARAMVHYTIGFGPQTTTSERGPLSLAPDVPVHRLELRAGKFSLADFFDQNGPGSDSHLQFMNWTVDNNGAYDYAADTRGYTYGLFAEYDAPRWALRGAEALMPTVANGITLDWDLGRARSDNIEVEFHPSNGFIVRGLGYFNHGNMGSYAEAIAAFRDGQDPVPNIVLHRQQGRTKSGVGGNLEKSWSGGLRAFARGGWNEGQNESFAYTEVNNTFQVGADLTGARWSRPGDKVGLVVVTNGLSTLHEEYLALGGLGFLLGDGALHYGREDILESYYTAHLWRGLFASADVQEISHPGYNRDRGPVGVGSLRLHIDF